MNETLTTLTDRLVTAAQREGLLDIAYVAVDSPIGSLLLTATESGLLRIAFEREDHDRVLDELANTVSPRIIRSAKRLDRTARELESYFGGTLTQFSAPVDLRVRSAFRRSVLAQLTQVGYGTTVSYGELAVASGNPKAVRAVGTACATNPVPIVIPCHRITRSDGSVGQYLGGADAKRMLIDLEARNR